MANQEHLDLLKQGSINWFKWRYEHSGVVPDFSRADLTEANIIGAYLEFADFTQTDLSRANLSRSLLGKADLSLANLTEADLTEANLMASDLSRANLSGANLSGANLSGANLSGAKLMYTLFADVDLSTVKGLTTVKHEGPSTIGIDTIYRSQRKIPERFLRDAGVPETFLDYMHTLVGQAIQYFTCFISHSHHDQLFCNRLKADLRSHDVPSWYFPEDATWGETVWGEIDRSIKRYDKLVVICSEHSLQSPKVLREIECALQREDNEGKNVLFPVRLDNYLFEQWEHERKADVVSKVVGDFRGWNSNADKYQAAFQKFLKALKAQEATAP
jgi:TIR domain/Pentapeptide repeats (8 copies)